MASRLLLLTILLAFSAQIYSHPIDFLRRISSSAQSDRNWLWGWAWGWGESTVSIVDRSPPLTFASRPAAFGPELTEPLLGYVIPLSSFTSPCEGDSLVSTNTTPNLGCPKLCVAGPNEPERADTWIALVQRGECQFVDKVREAQRLGANAVVVGGDDPEISGYPDGLINMYSPDDSSDVSIAATFIKYSDYRQLSSLIAVSNTTHSGLRTLSLMITADYSAWEWYSPVLTFAIILLLPSSLTLVTLLIHRVRASRAAQRDRAPEEIVKNLPSRIWTGTGLEKDHRDDNEQPPSTPPQDVDLERGAESLEAGGDSSTSSPAQHQEHQAWHESQVECAICLSDFVKGDTVRILPCHHIFHLDEVDAWLIHRKKLCPICKADVTQPLLKPGPREHSVPAEEPESMASVEDPRSPAASERTPLLQRS